MQCCDWCCQASNCSLRDFGVVIDKQTTHHGLVVVDFSGQFGLIATRLHIDMQQPNVGSAFHVQSRGFEIINNTMYQSGNCTRSQSRVIYMHGSDHGVIAGNTVDWNCAAWSADVSDNVIVENNTFACIAKGPINGGTFIATYDLYHHPSSKWWAVSRNTFSRPVNSTPDSWQFHETITTDAPHSYNMGYIEQIYTVNGTAAVKLGARLRPPVGATIVALGGSGSGQYRLVTGKLPGPYINTYTLSSSFDGWLRPNITKVAALPTAAQKLVVGNSFIGANGHLQFAN